MSELLHIKDHSIERLREQLAEAGERPYRADQIAAWLYRRGIEDPEQMTDLGAELRARLAREWQLSALEVERVDRSVDGTCKAALVARDGARIESVLIPEDDRMTLCVSTQVGCAMACSSAPPASWASRATCARRRSSIRCAACARSRRPDRPISNVVFMGMGEPLLNLDAVVEAIRLLIDPKAFAIAPRRVTVSTVGLVPKIGELLRARAGQSGGVAARHDRRGARPARAAEPPLSARGAARRAARAAHRDARGGRCSSSTR